MTLTFSLKAISNVFEKATNAVSLSTLVNKIDTIRDMQEHMTETDSVVSDLQERAEAARTATASNTARISELEAELARLKAAQSARS